MTDQFEYATRAVHSVNTWGFNRTELKDGSEGVSASVTINLESVEEPGMPGPQAQLQFTIKSSAKLTLAEIEDQILNAAASLMSRFGSCSITDLHAARSKGYEFKFHQL